VTPGTQVGAALSSGEGTTGAAAVVRLVSVDAAGDGDEEDDAGDGVDAAEVGASADIPVHAVSASAAEKRAVATSSRFRGTPLTYRFIL